MLDLALHTSLRSLSDADVKEIAFGGVQEDGTIEFKSGLDEGSERDQTSWADGGKFSRSAKTDLLRAHEYPIWNGCRRHSFRLQPFATIKALICGGLAFWASLRQHRGWRRRDRRSPSPRPEGRRPSTSLPF